MEILGHFAIQISGELLGDDITISDRIANLSQRLNDFYDFERFITFFLIFIVRFFSNFRWIGSLTLLLLLKPV